MRTVSIELKVRATLKVDEGVGISELLDEAELRLELLSTAADVESCDIEGHEVLDSR